VRDEDGTLDFQLGEGRGDHRALCRRRPDTRARTFGIAESGPVERDHAVAVGEAIDHAAGFKVLEGDTVAVQQHHRCAGAAFDIMEPDPIDLDEASRGRRFGLGLAAAPVIEEGAAGEGGSGRSGGSPIGMFA
jgi:hypothetical protein